MALVLIINSIINDIGIYIPLVELMGCSVLLHMILYYTDTREDYIY